MEVARASSGHSAPSFLRRSAAEPPLDDYRSFRAEGLPLKKAIWSGLAYVRKYLFKSDHAPAATVDYFDQQRATFRHLRDQQVDLAGKTAASLAMVGDLMWIRDGWSDFLTPEVRDRLNQHEVVLGNLETHVSEAHSCPWMLPDAVAFNSKPELVTSFARPDQSSTFTALAVANNHCLDMGPEAARNTLAFLDSQGIAHSGIRFDETTPRYTTFEKNGIKFGFYAATWGLNDPSQEKSTEADLNLLPGLAPAPQSVAEVKLDEVASVLGQMEADGVDFKIVSLHWGYEFERYPDAKVMQVGREVVKLGADVIMGHHPHVQQPSEVLFLDGYEKDLDQSVPADACLTTGGKPRKAMICYSLGNFTTNMYTFTCEAGMLASMNVTKEEASGRVDWFNPDYDFVFNSRWENEGRRLMRMDDFLARGNSDQDQRQQAAELRRHMTGAV
ncbi:MAG: CapA family protein [Vulcanimicrobiota bacterium]